MSLNLNIYQTLAAAIVVYYVGVFLRVKISVLRKYCIPAPVVGGILFAIINCILYTQGIWKYEQDTIMQNICMMLFFTSVGYTASISLIKRGGVMVLKMAIVTTVLIICQNIIGSGLAMAFNLSPLLGLATGSIPMVGGHGTAAAFGPLLESIGLVFPGYIGSMIVAAIIRNIADFTHAYKIYQRESEVLGNLSLTVFLTCVLMSLKLWQLADLAIPLVVMLLSQALFMAIFAYFIVFRAMGKDYEAAVMTSGVCGFGLGATPNAIANMTAMTELFGPAPTAFFVIPLIGSLIIDPVNASIITVFINIFH